MLYTAEYCAKTKGKVWVYFCAISG